MAKKLRVTWPWPRPLFANFFQGSCRDFGSRRPCQISSKSVKNWDRERARTHTHKCVGHRTSDTGHRTSHRKWFYILSNAAIHSIGQTISLCMVYLPMYRQRIHYLLSLMGDAEITELMDIARPDNPAPDQKSTVEQSSRRRI